MKTVLLILPFLVSTALGRIGESLEECRMRYGKEIATAEDGTTFKKGTFTVVITYWKDKAVTVTYSRAKDQPITDDEATVLMELNAPGAMWMSTGTSSTPKGTQRFWLTNDARLSADAAKEMVRVTDVAAQQLMSEELKQEKLNKVRAALEGL